MSDFDPRDLEVSLFDSGKAPTPSATISLERWWYVITGPDLREATATARKLAREEAAAALGVAEAEQAVERDGARAPGRSDALADAQEQLKRARQRRSIQKNKAFVSVTCGGTFDRRLKPDVLERRQALPRDHKDHLPPTARGQLSRTGLVPLDFDHLLTRAAVDELVDELRADPAIAFVYRSPSGFGVKAFVAVDPVPETYEEHVWAAEAMFAAYDRAAADAKGGKDAHRLSYGAYDPDAFVAAQVSPRRWRRPVSPPPAEPAPPPEVRAEGAYTRKAIEGQLQDLLGSKVGDRHDAAVAAAMRLVGLVKAGELDDATARTYWQTAFDAVKPDQMPTEAEDIWRHAQTNAEPAVVPQRGPTRVSRAERMRRDAADLASGGVDLRQGARPAAPPAPTEPYPGAAAVAARFAQALAEARGHPAWCEDCYQGTTRCAAHLPASPPLAVDADLLPSVMQAAALEGGAQGRAWQRYGDVLRGAQDA